MRNRMTLINHPTSSNWWFPFEGTPRFIPSFPAEHQQVIEFIRGGGGFEHGFFFIGR